MSNIILSIHLILALILISVVLMQRSEGGGLGSSGGSANDGLMSGRAAATAMTKLTWLIATAFIITSISLTILSAKKSSTNSVFDSTTSSEELKELDIPLPSLDTLESINTGGSPTSPPAE